MSGRHPVALRDMPARPTLVVAATTTWAEFPALWPVLLDEVWSCLRAAGIGGGCRNVMLYRDGAAGAAGAVRVEVGVAPGDGIDVPLDALTGRVTASHLPAGAVATTVHAGPYAGLAAAHRAVGEACATQGRRPAGVRWEVYGPHREDPDDLRTEVCWLLA